MSAKAEVSTDKKEKTPATEIAASDKRTKSNAEHLFRFSTVDADSADDEEKTIQVCFSSEELVLRKATEYDELLGIAPKGTKYWELLSHRKGDCDFSELDGGKGTVLDEHENSLQLGKVPRAKRSKDAVGRAVLKFDGLSELSNTRYEQMKRGERTGVSTGYWHTKFIGDEGEKDGYPIKRLAWAADEISSVRNAADKNRAGVRRSAEGQWACLCCGNMFDRAKLDENFECGCENEIRTKRSAIKERKSRKADDFKFVRADKTEIFFSDLRDMVSVAADSDKRFKAKQDNGNIFSAFFVDDIKFAGGKWFAIIFNWFDGTYWEVGFEIEGETVALGEAVEVRPVTDFEPVERAAETKTIARTVDSKNLSEADKTARNNLPKPIMAKSVAELKTEAPELVTQIETDTRTATEKTTRATITAEFKGESGKRAVLVKEIRALANGFVKDKGPNFYGKPGEVTTVGERVRSFEQEALQIALTDETRSDSEIRSDFKNRANEVIRESRAPKNPLEAAVLPEVLASRCSLGNLLSSAMRDKRWQGEGPYMADASSAEGEADAEIRKTAAEFPGGEIRGAGVQLPINMPTGIRSRTPMPKMKRDALAGDFASAGAFISPDYRFPFIELLRNMPVLARAGMTMLTGLQGGRLVLPRQEAATTAQWVAEGAALAQYDQALGQINLNPHRIGSSQHYSRLALLQATSLEEMIWADHMAQIALGIDSGILNGTGGANQPLGILNTVGIGSITFSGSAANAFKNAVAMETAVRKANIFEDGTFLTTSTSRGMLKSTAKLLVGATTVAANPVWGDDETIAGRPGFDSQQIPGDILLYLVGRHVIFAQWGGLAVCLDTLTRADRDEYKLSLNTYVDGGLRHAQAVCRTSDSVASLS